MVLLSLVWVMMNKNKNKGGKYDSNKRRSSRSSQYKTVDKA